MTDTIENKVKDTSMKFPETFEEKKKYYFDGLKRLCERKSIPYTEEQLSKEAEGMAEGKFTYL